MSVYITASLLGALQFYCNAPGNWKDRAKESLLNNINKIYVPYTKAQKAGLSFEDTIRQVSEGELISEDPVINEIARIVTGGTWQKVCQKEININGLNIVLYGLCDVIKDDIIYDIKKTGKYTKNKYQKSMQHRIYMYCKEIDNFEYLISAGQKLYKEKYIMTIKTKPEILSSVHHFLSWIKINDLYDTYLEKWEWKNSL